MQRLSHFQHAALLPLPLPLLCVVLSSQDEEMLCVHQLLRVLRVFGGAAVGLVADTAREGWTCGGANRHPFPVIGQQPSGGAPN